MSKPFDIVVKDNVTKALQMFGDEARAEFEGAIKDAAQEWEEVAAKSASLITDLGGLMEGITSDGRGLNWSVMSAAHYSPYIEWGTITFVNVPGEYSTYAAQFKGKGLKKTGGMYARPFFFIHKDRVFNKLEKDLGF